MTVFRVTTVLLFLSAGLILRAQPGSDSLVIAGGKVITLSNVVIDKKMDVSYLVSRVISDSSFYKCFRNLRILEYTAINDIRMFDKKGNLSGSLNSTTRQHRRDGCRTMEVLKASSSGDIFDSDSGFNYYTAEMYASLFFTRGMICGETNTVGEASLSLSGKTGMDKRREQLKMLFFNPGKRIRGLPFLSGKTELFDDNLAGCYDMTMDYDDFQNRNCYVFTQTVKPGMEDRVIVNQMKTWFLDSSFQVLARSYSMSYNAGLFDFNVEMQVEMGPFGDLWVPVLLRYTGNWKAPFHKRERGAFTATLFDFSN